MVIVLMDKASARVRSVATALATELGWRLHEADPSDPDTLRAVFTQAIGRREPTIVASDLLSAKDRIRAALGLRPIRFVELSNHRNGGTPRLPAEWSDVLALPLDADPEANIQAIRHEFGV